MDIEQMKKEGRIKRLADLSKAELKALIQEGKGSIIFPRSIGKSTTSPLAILDLIEQFQEGKLLSVTADAANLLIELDSVGDNDKKEDRSADSR